MIWGTLVILGLLCGEIKTQNVVLTAVSTPIVESEEITNMYILEDMHRLSLLLDTEQIDNKLKEVEIVIRQGMEHLEENYLVDGTPPTGTIVKDGIDNVSTKLVNGSKIDKMFKKTLGKIKIQLAATLTSLEKIQQKFHEFMEVEFPKISFTYNDSTLEDEVIKGVVFHELITMLKDKLGNLSHPDNNFRAKRSSEADVPLIELTSHIGHVMNNMGASYHNNKWKIETGMKVSQESILDLFQFSEIMANRINMTIKYIRAAEKVNMKLIQAVFNNAEHLIQTIEDLDKVEIIQNYLFNLIQLHFSTVDLTEHIVQTEYIIADSSETLSPFLISPNELKQYMVKFGEYSNYEAVVDIDQHLFIYYNMLKVEKILDGKVLAFNIEIPIRQTGTAIKSFSKISIKKLPFQLNDKIVILDESLPTSLFYSEEDNIYFDSSDCTGMKGVTLCTPKIYKKSTCLDQIVKGELWVPHCNIKDYRIGESLEQISKDKFIRIANNKDTLKCHCSLERVTDRKLHVTLVETDYELDEKVQLINIPSNCTCKTDNYYIPRRGAVRETGEKNIIWLDNFNISNMDLNINPSGYNSSILTDYINTIKEDFIQMKNKFSKSEASNIIMKWAAPLQIVHISIFSIFLAITAIVILIKWGKKKRSTNLQAQMEGQKVTLNVINLDENI